MLAYVRTGKVRRNDRDSTEIGGDRHKHISYLRAGSLQLCATRSIDLRQIAAIYVNAEADRVGDSEERPPDFGSFESGCMRRTLRTRPASGSECDMDHYSATASKEGAGGSTEGSSSSDVAPAVETGHQDFRSVKVAPLSRDCTTPVSVTNRISNAPALSRLAETA